MSVNFMHSLSLNFYALGMTYEGGFISISLKYGSEDPYFPEMRTF